MEEDCPLRPARHKRRGSGQHEPTRASGDYVHLSTAGHLLQRPLVHLSRAGQLTPADLQNAIDRLALDLDHFALRDLTLDICRWRVMPIVSTPRSLDLAHLRTALWFHQRQPLTRFVSLDVPQNQAARELGLPV
jgi:hypothetical protein